MRVEHGYFIVARKTFNSEVMDWSPVWFKLWIWLIGAANHQTETIKGNIYRRGEVLTSYKELMEVASYKVGWRRIKPSKTVIRRFCEALRKTSMATTKKTIRGFVIKLENYDHYQTSSNYEDHTEKPPKTTLRPQTGSTIYNKNDNNNINNRAMPSVDNSGGNVDNSAKRGMGDIADALQSSLDKMKKAKPARNVPEWMRHALEVSDKLQIDWNHPELVKHHIKVRWFSLFKHKSWGELQSAYSFCYDYPNRPDSAGMVKLFFWKSGHKDQQLAP